LVRFLHISLSFLLLISTTGISVSKHICGNAIRNIALFHEADGCYEGMEDMGCCHNENEHHQVTDNFQKSALQLDLTFKAPFISLFSWLMVEQHYGKRVLDTHTLSDHTESPPLFQLDRTVQYGIFLL